jgi:hypothetical protein
MKTSQIYKNNLAQSLKLITEICTSLSHYERLVLMGDFNIDLLDETNPNCSEFCALIENLGYTQLVTSPTRSSQSRSSLLDIILVKVNTNIIPHYAIQPGISDHDSVHFTLTLKSASLPTSFETIVSRNYKNVNFDQLSESFLNHVTDTLCQLTTSQEALDVNLLIGVFDVKVKEVLDIYAPVRAKRRVIKRRPPWFNEEVILKRKELRRIERHLRRHSSSANLHEAFKNSKQSLKKTIRVAKRSYWVTNLAKIYDDPKRLWTQLLRSTGKVATHALPSLHGTNHLQLATKFNEYFQQKVILLKNTLPQITPPLNETSKCLINLSFHSLTYNRKRYWSVIRGF